MTKIMFGNYQPDVASIDTTGTSYVKNVVPTPNGFGPVMSLVTFTQALPARCLGYFSCIDSSNTVHVFAGTATKLYKLNATTRVWADVSTGSYNVADREFWSFAQFGANVIAVANGNNPQLFTLGSSSVFADLGGSPPQARRVSVVGDFLVLQGLTSNPYRIQWSGLNNITQWTPGTASSDYQDFPDGGYVRGVGGGEFGIVFQDTAIRRMIFNPVSGTIFDFSRISEDRGLYMPYSLAKSHSSLFFFAADGFYRVDASGALTPIGANRVNLTLIADADLTNPRYMVGAADPNSQRIIWAYKSKANTNPNYLDKNVTYDWSLDRWSYGETSVEYIDTCSPLTTTLESLDAVGNLDALPFSLDNYISATQGQLAAIDTTHKLGFFSGSTLEATIDTPEGAIGEGRLMQIKDGVAPIGDPSAAYLSVSYRARLEDAAIRSSETTFGRRGYCPQRVTGRFMTARIRVPAATSWTFLRGVDVDGRTGGWR